MTLFKERYPNVEDHIKNPGKYHTPTRWFQNQSTTSSSHPEMDVKQWVDLVASFDNPIIVDLGGGPAIHYRPVQNFSIKKYIIVELEYIIERAKKEPVVEYVNLIEEVDESIDIFYSNGGLQYIHQPSIFLDYLQNTLQPSKILLQRIHITPKKTYISLQKETIPYWFFNLEFFQQLDQYNMQELPTDVISYARFTGPANEQVHFKNLLFTRK